MPGRFAALDLLRGVAAFSVLLWHAPTVDGRPVLGRAYLAVDLFFVLSGFVIAHAYEHRLRSGGQFQRFCLARLIRLYPLYLACTLMSAGLAALAAIFGTGTHVSMAQLARTLFPALLFLPTPTSWSVQPPWLFPLAFTAWSLLWELLVNLVYGAGGYLLRGAFLAVPIVIGAFAIVAGLWIRGTVELGWAW